MREVLLLLWEAKLLQAHLPRVIGKSQSGIPPPSSPVHADQSHLPCFWSQTNDHQPLLLCNMPSPHQELIKGQPAYTVCCLLDSCVVCGHIQYLMVWNAFDPEEHFRDPNRNILNKINLIMPFIIKCLTFAVCLFDFWDLL